MLNCKYCFYKTKELKYSDCHNEIAIETTIEKLINLNVKHVILTGGDPLHPQIFVSSMKIIKLLQDNGIDVSLNTSLAITETELDKLVSIFSGTLYVSCDSHLVSIHDKQRGKGKLTMHGIDFVLKYNMRTVVSAVITKENYKNITDTFDYFLSLGVAAVDFNIAYIPRNNPYYYLSCEDLALEEKLQLVKSLFYCANLSSNSKKQEAFYKYQAKYFLGLDFVSEMVPLCKMGNKFFVINRNGEIKKCFHASEPINNVLDLDHNGKNQCAGKHCVSLFVIDDFWKDG